MPRLSGARGSIYLQDSSTKLLDSYMWEFEEVQDVAECSIKGENFKRYAADVGSARVRIQSFVSTIPASAVTGYLDRNLVTTAGVGTAVDFSLEFFDTGSASNQIVIGQGYIVRAQLHVARDGIITDEIEIEVDGHPLVV